MCVVGCQCKGGFYRHHGKCVADCTSGSLYARKNSVPCPDPNAVRKSCGVRRSCQPVCFSSIFDYGEVSSVEKIAQVISKSS
ncbi:hypothetical protein ANCCAN_04090 [Ancylostoma caninum]|uniref:TIL domain-containing protein n=1 Tax=Ancylostoma caninum TaxID=29170 RepID=A0A368H3J4_ANCCA|nr:hypothetical protein ANCCAN_04090 [Ancylostoma caninum]